MIRLSIEEIVRAAEIEEGNYFARAVIQLSGYIATLEEERDALRKDAFKEAIDAIENEFLEDPTDSADDIAYDLAVSDCLKAVAAIAAKEPK